MKNKLKCSIGIIVHNESANIARLIKALQDQELSQVLIKEIIVISSASTDGTDEIVRNLLETEDRLQLITEPERRGKSAAINKFIRAARSEILIIESGDTVPARDTVEKLVSVFSDPMIGMAGGRPVPENESTSLVGYSVNLLWKLHHRMAMVKPKLGEMVAFRKVFSEIPEKSAVDEASIEAIIQEKGLELKYVPGAVIHNKGPENLRDFISQRRRIAAGHIWLLSEQHYAVSSQNRSLLLKLAVDELRSDPAQIFKLIFTMIIELYSRFLGWFDLRIRRKNPFKWEIASSTKELTLPAAKEDEND